MYILTNYLIIKYLIPANYPTRNCIILTSIRKLYKYLFYIGHEGSFYQTIAQRWVQLHKNGPCSQLANTINIFFIDISK